MIGWLFTGGAVLVVVGWLGYRRRLAGIRESGRLGDEAIRQIEASGRLELEEPLDLREAAEEEDEFWSETWDEPEPL